MIEEHPNFDGVRAVERHLYSLVGDAVRRTNSIAVVTVDENFFLSPNHQRVPTPFLLNAGF